MFSAMESLICDYTDAMNIVSKLLQTSCLARRPDEHAGLVAELVGSFGRLSEQ